MYLPTGSTQGVREVNLVELAHKDVGKHGIDKNNNM